jgi:hypothetical protein
MTQRTTTILRLVVAATFLAVLAACGEQTTPVTQNTVAVTVEGDGAGTVTSDPAGINVTTADGSATFEFDTGTEVILTAQAEAGSTFAGWGGDCAGAGMDADCVIQLDDDASVTATFTEDEVVVEGPFDLTVQKAGAGDGTITSDVPGLELAVGETEATATDLAEDTVVTLTATPDGTSIFTGWSGGGCSGTDPCEVTMTADTTVTATFSVPGGEVTETFAIQTGSDDAEEYVNPVNADFPAGSVDLGSTDLDLTFDTADIPGTTTDRGEVIVGLRFDGVTVPQGSTISAATITFTRDSSSGTSITYEIVGQAADDAGTFVYEVGVGNNDVSSRATTAATVNWVQTPLTDAEIDTADVSSIVQEVVDRGGWTSGNALVFVISSDNSTAGNFLRVDSFEGGTPAELTLTYTTPAE